MFPKGGGGGGGWGGGVVEVTVLTVFGLALFFMN